MGNPLSTFQHSPTERIAVNSQTHNRGDYTANRNSNNTNTGFITIFNYFGLRSTNSSEDYTEIFQLLYDSGPGYEWYKYLLPKPVEGTCTWVTEHPTYKDWLERKCGVLWLSADAGCGKSVIASFLVECLGRGKDAIICYFFFKEDSPGKRTAKSALCAILHQLFTQRKPLCRYAEEMFKARGKWFAEEVNTLWDILIRAITEGNCGNVICVVDALDECEEQTRYQLIDHIKSLSGSQSPDVPLKFVVTSRSYGRIVNHLDAKGPTMWLRGEDEVKAINADVALVIEDGIKKLESRWGIGKLGYLRNILVHSADRTFLWVSLVIEDLIQSDDGSPEALKKIVRTAPRTLAKFYTKMLDKSKDPTQARQVLHIVAGALRPLTIQEMNAALRIVQGYDPWDLSDGFEMTVKNFCGLFVRVIDSKIYLVHQTAKEFLIKGSLAGEGAWQYTLCPKESKFIMADACIAYLSLADFEHDPLARGKFNGATREEVDKYLQKYALLHYAASHWADHIRDSQDRQMKLFERTRFICETGSNRFLTWFRVYWVISGQHHPFPNDFTHLMIASWLGQGVIVEQLLEGGEDINARSEQFGTALNIAALQKDKGVIEILLGKEAKAYIGGKEYNILDIKASQSLFLGGRITDAKGVVTIDE